MERKEVTIQELEELDNGTLFSFDTWDSDDNTSWRFKYCKSNKGFIYLGGGIDFGESVGKVVSSSEVLQEINNIDFPKIGICELKAKN